MTKIRDTRQPAVMRAGPAGPTAPGERTASCGRDLGAPRLQQATRGDQRQRADTLSRVSRPNPVFYCGFFCIECADRTGGTQPLALRASPLPMFARP
jgi:hypothetical protein